MSVGAAAKSEDELFRVRMSGSSCRVRSLVHRSHTDGNAIIGGTYMAVPDDYLIAGLSITGHFEDAREPLAGVTGNFDGMGISLGVLQWNIGSNSLQPIVKALGRDVCTSTMPHLGDDLWKACNAPVAQGLAVVRAWQPANALPNSARDELRAFVKSRQFQDLQLKTAHAVGDQAWNTASDWAQRQRRTSPTKREFCWFYDVFTQNGSLKSVTPATVQAFIDNHGAAQADEIGRAHV